MSEVRIAKIGEEITFDAEFIDDNDAAVELQAAPTFKITSHEGDFILDGTGAQDTGAPERWVASVTMPDGIPPTAERTDFYVIRWSGRDAAGDRHRVSEKFKVSDALDESEAPLEPVVTMQGDDEAVDYFKSDDELSSYKIYVVDPFTGEKELIHEDNDPSVFKSVNGVSVYKAEIDLEDFNATHVNPGVLCNQLHWEVIHESGEKEREIHDFYVLSAQVWQYVSKVRFRLDKGQLWNLNPALNINNWEIAAALLIAIDRINVAPATQTSWTMGSLPANMSVFLLDLTCIELLRAMLMAEGMSAFDFSGQSTQLTSDRTQYIQTQIDQIGQDIDTKVRVAKKAIIRRSGGVLHINIGPSTVYPTLMNSASYMRARMFSVMNIP